MSTALAANPHQVNNVVREQQPIDDERGQHSQVTQPAIQTLYQDAQIASNWCSLPEEIVPVILKHADKGVFNFGLTCKYWNLIGRNFLTKDNSGRCILRKKYADAFRRKHRMSVTNAFRGLNSTSFEKFFTFDNNRFSEHCLKQLKTSDEPVYLVTPRNGQWITTDLKTALASRSCKLTIMEIDVPDGDSMNSIIAAIQAIPSNGFAALSISSDTLSAPTVGELWSVISNHPVVVHIECNGNNELSTGDDVVAWMTLLSKKNANVSSFSLNNCRLDEQSGETLLALLAGETDINELEVCEVKTSAENAKNLFSALRIRNARAHQTLSLYFMANNMEDFIDARERCNLVGDGIYIRDPGQQWAIQLDPIVEEPSRDNSSDNDSSSVVGDPSSGDEGWGSEFESPDEDSDVIVESPSDSEG